eukprot:PhM_4_TR8474/c1_g1_i3/m.104063/K10244/ELOVL5; elongation of very long chain fatty acids protein 5
MMDMTQHIFRSADQIDYPPSHCVDTDAAGLCFNKHLSPLVSLPVILGGHLFYIAAVVALKAWMATREKPFGLKGPMMLYNATQVVLSIIEVVALGPYLANYFFNLGGQFNAHIEFWVLVHFLSKFLDFFDTFFMCLRKKSEQISFLHVYHHLTIGVIWGLLLHNGLANGVAFFGAWMNSLVHALMYFHYLWTSLGFKNPFKKYLTMFQMFQFSLCIVQAALVVVVDTAFPFNWAVLQLTYHCTLLFLFNRFYKADRKKEGKNVRATHNNINNNNHNNNHNKATQHHRQGGEKKLAQ